MAKSKGELLDACVPRRGYGARVPGSVWGEPGARALPGGEGRAFFREVSGTRLGSARLFGSRRNLFYSSSELVRVKSSDAEEWFPGTRAILVTSGHTHLSLRDKTMCPLAT